MLQDDLELAVRLAREAGDFTRELFLRGTLRVDAKADGSPVTEADVGAERLIRERLRRERPADAVLGEEEGESPGTSGRRWILDPIDGTVSFVHGVPLFGTLIGLEQEDEAVLGVIALPALDELVWAARGLGAHWVRAGGAPRPARVSETASLAEATLCTTSVKTAASVGLEPLYGRLVRAVRCDRGWSDCYAHALVATGRVDLVVEPFVSVWDCAALLPIVEEAGGAFTDHAGTRTIRGGNALASNGRVHAEALALIAATPRHA